MKQCDPDSSCQGLMSTVSHNLLADFYCKETSTMLAMRSMTKRALDMAECHKP